MAVRIEDINLQGVGPLTTFRLKPGAVSLVYGHNECGKTFLVEFLIRSLFKAVGPWGLRDGGGKGQVRVSGLGEAPVAFNPSSKKKLESYLEDSSVGVPPSLGRLLVVKGAELAIMDGGAPIGQRVLKEYLSSESVLDMVESRIPKALQEAHFESGRLIGRNQGKLKELDAADAEIRKLSELFERIDEQYSEGQRQLNRIRLQRLHVEAEVQLKAKRHLAQRLAGEIKTVDGELNRLPESELRSLAQSSHDQTQLEGELSRLIEDQAEAEKRSEHYLWVKNAVQVYEEYGRAIRGLPPVVLPIIAGVLLIAAAVVGVFPWLVRIQYLAPSLIGLALILGTLSMVMLRRAAMDARKNAEIEALRADYEARFGAELLGLAALKENEEELERDHHRADLLREHCELKRNELAKVKDGISDLLHRLGQGDRKPEDWSVVADELSKRRASLDEKRRTLERQFDRLDVPEESYLEDDSLPEYDPELLNRLQGEELTLRDEISKDENQLSALRQAVCAVTGDQIGLPWEQLLENLRKLLDGKIARHRQLWADALASVVTYEALSDLRATQRDQIVKGLQSPLVLTPLKAITHRYEHLDLDGENLVVSDPYSAHPFANLSTGTQEQILLALRIGFASTLLRTSSLFLILDDAFQHSDWRRREYLVDEVIELARHEWQIIYLTMDDQIRDLFKAKGSTVFGDQFTYQELPETFMTAE